MTDEQFAKGLGHMVGSALDLLECEDKARAAEAMIRGRGEGLRKMGSTMNGDRSYSRCVERDRVEKIITFETFEIPNPEPTIKPDDDDLDREIAARIAAGSRCWVPVEPEPEWPILTTLGAIRQAHPTWQDAGQTDGEEWLCDDLPVAIGSDGSVYLPDDDEISPPDPDFRGWAESERARLLQRIGSEV